MIFKTLSKSAFRELVEILLAEVEVIGPRQVRIGRNGKPLYQFRPVDGFDQIAFDYDQTQYSAKTYFLPFKQCLSRYTYSNGDWEQEIDYECEPRALIGLHACDIHGLLKLDKVFMRDRYPSPYYIARRKNTLIVGLDHMPSEGCFCQSVGADIVTHGFDMFLTDLGDRYFVAVSSDRAYMLVDRVDSHDVTEKDTQDYLAERERIAAAFTTKVEVDHLPMLLDLEFDSPIWEIWGERCLSCGACAMVCPTCYCFGVTDQVSMDLSAGEKVQHLHSCNLLDFAMVAGGHNFRPTRASRLKYRYYHQHRGFSEAYDEPKCVGCNRCGNVCLAGINPPAVIKHLQEEGLR